MQRVRLEQIAFDAGTQIRAAIDQQVVNEYAEAMTNGATFPPIVLFHDGNRHYLADGFHRYMAARRIEWREIDADVNAGTKDDALWFALGANKANAHQMTSADRRHAISLAISTWGDAKSSTQIAEQMGIAQQRVSEVRVSMRQQAQVTGVGNLSDRVTGKDGKTYPAARATDAQQRSTKGEIAARIQAGQLAHAIRQELRVPLQLIADVRRELGVGLPDKSRAAVSQRRQDVRDLAARGHSSRQIAKLLSIGEKSVAAIAKQEQIVIHADRVIGKSKRHDSNRIVDRMVMDADNLTADVNLIEFTDLDRARLAGWIDSLKTSRDKLMGFIRLLMKEQQKHGEAA